MSATFTFAGLAVLVAVVAWRPHGFGPMLGAAAAVGVAAIGGAVEPGDFRDALAAQWRAYVTLAAVMTMTSAAERLGIVDRLAAVIEPRTRGPALQAFRVTFALAFAVAAVLSNDAAILLVTPIVIVLLRAVYPKRSPKFVVPFAFAVFAAAGVAPLVISNPMNLVFAEHRGIDFNVYSAKMIPIAIACALVTYATLAWWFRDVLADPAPALGAWPAQQPLGTHARVVLAVLALALAAYPIAAYANAPVWPIAAAGGAACATACVAARHPLGALARGIAWPIFPFLLGVFVLAVALSRVGVVDWLRDHYSRHHPIAVIGATSAIGSAALNNHPMSVLNALALDGMRDLHHARAFAALIGGDLGPRLLPVGSLAALLWYDLLRRYDVRVPVTTFARVGFVIAVPALVVSLGVLWLLTYAGW